LRLINELTSLLFIFLNNLILIFDIRSVQIRVVMLTKLDEEIIRDL